VVESYSLASREGSQELGKVIAPRWGRTIDEYWYHADLSLQGGGDLDYHQVIRIVEPAAAAIVSSVEPVAADECQQYVTRADRVRDGIGEVQTGFDCVDVNEDVPGAEASHEPVEQTSRDVRGVGAAIANKIRPRGAPVSATALDSHP
jgi:hypothetical protein